MEFMLLFFLCAFAMGGANECYEDKMEECVASLLEAMLGDSNDEESCGELEKTIDCLHESASECDINDDEIETGISQLERLLQEECEGDANNVVDSDEQKELDECFETNEDYFYECIEEGTAKALTHFEGETNLDENVVKCTVYSMIAGCFVERTGEKCGNEVKAMVEEELLNSMPREIKTACEKAGDIHIIDIELNDKKK